MNQLRKNVVTESFISGGIYDPTSSSEKQDSNAKVENDDLAKSTNQKEALNDEGENIEAEIGNEKIPYKKIFTKRKKSSERMRIKKVRQNSQLRKSISPKNALMALNEVKGVQISEFTLNENPGGGFTALVTVNSKEYEGKGPSKMAAKNLACENAFRDYIISKMKPGPKKAKNAQTSDDSGEGMDVDDEKNAENEDDDMPMLNLASFAIYKLFAEWESVGYYVPEMHVGNAGGGLNDSNTSNAASTPKEPKQPPVRTELPDNWKTLHPTTLLCVMHPGVTYIDHGTIGEKPNVMQRLGVIVGNQEFTANGRSKKVARRNVAVNVCNNLFNTDFNFEEN